MAKHHLFLHIGPDVVEIDVDVRGQLAAVGVRTPDVSQDELHRADLEIRRAHKAAGLKRKDVEGAWAGVCRRTCRTDAPTRSLSEPGFFEADADQAALAIDGLVGLKVHLVVTGARPSFPTAWTRLVKPERIHVIEPGVSSSDFAARLARIVLSEEKARLDKALLKAQEAPQEGQGAARRLISRSVRLPGVFVGREVGDRAGSLPSARSWIETPSKTARRRAAGGDPDVLEHLGRLAVGHRLGPEAVDRDQRAVDGADDVGDGDRLGRAREAPAAGLSALGDHDVGATQVGQDRLQEAVRDVLGLPELFGTDG